LLGFDGGAFRGSGVIAEIDQGGDNIGFGAGRGGGCRLLCFDSYGLELVFQLYDDALGGFAADAGDTSEAGQVAAADRGH
jgi:hypothetical protein